MLTSIASGDASSSGSVFKNILRSFSLYSIANIGQPLASMLLLPVISSYLRAEDYGVLGTVEQIANLLTLLLGGNFSAALGYFYFQSDGTEKRRRVIGTTILGAGLLGALAAALSWPLGQPLSRLVFGKGVNVFYLRVMLLGMPAGFAMEALFAWLRVADRAFAYAIASMFRVLAGACTALLLIVYFRLNVLGMILGGMSAVTLPVLVLLPYCWRVEHPAFDRSTFVRMAKFSAPIGFGGIALFCINFGDRLILPRYVSLADIGRYSIAYKIGMLVSLFYSSFHTFWSAQVYGLMKRDDAGALFARILTYLVGALSLVVLGLVVFAEPAIRILTPHRDYAGAAVLIPIIAVAYGIRSLGDFFRCRFYVAGRPAFDAICNWLGAAVCLAGYLIWIPKFGVWGAAFATVVSFLTVLGIVLIWTYRLSPYRMEASRLFKIIAAVAGTMGTFLAVPAHSLAAQIALGAAVVAAFPTILWLLQFPSAEERDLVSRTIGLVGRRSGRQA